MQNIVVSRVQNLGDTIMATPILFCLKQLYPKAKLTFITRPLATAAVDRLDFIDQIIAFSDEKRLAEELQVFQAFRKADLAYLMDTTHRISVLAWLAGAKQRIGMSHHRKWYLTKAVPWQKKFDLQFDPQTFADILKIGSDIDITKINDWNQYYFSEANDREKQHVEIMARQIGLNIDQAYIVFSLYTGEECKNWPSEYWRQLWAMVAKKFKVQIVLTGSNPHKLALGDNVYDMSGKTNIHEFGYLVKKSILVISGCSSPIHVARAFDVPTIGLYGPTPVHVGAPPEIFAAIRSVALCSPCNGYYSSPCKDSFCMGLIKPETVYTEVEKFLLGKVECFENR